jgi:hypothetical protein
LKVSPATTDTSIRVSGIANVGSMSSSFKIWMACDALAVKQWGEKVLDEISIVNVAPS